MVVLMCKDGGMPVIHSACDIETRLTETLGKATCAAEEIHYREAVLLALTRST